MTAPPVFPRRWALALAGLALAVGTSVATTHADRALSKLPNRLARPFTISTPKRV